METKYGSAQRPVVVILYHIVDKRGDHHIISINDYSMTERFKNPDGYEEHLRSRYSFFERLGTADMLRQGDEWTIGANGAQLRDRVTEMRSRYPGAEIKMWMPDGEVRVVANDLTAMIETLATAIHNRVQPVIMTRANGDASQLENGYIWIRTTPVQIQQLLKHRPTDAIAAAVVYFIDQPPSMLDACVTVSFTSPASEASLSLSCPNPSWRMTELGESFDPLHALHLLWLPEGQADMFLLAEKHGDEFRCAGWIGYEQAKRSALEGKAKDSGRSSDFKDKNLQHTDDHE